jgi:hypothetical protein
MPGEGGRIRSTPDKLGDPGDAGEEVHHLLWGLEHDSPAALRHLRHVTHELHHVAEALLDVDEDPPAVERLAAPLRLLESARRRDEAFHAPAPFVFAPARRIIAAQQSHQAEMKVRIGIVGAESERAAVAGLGLVEPADGAIGDAQAVMEARGAVVGGDCPADEFDRGFVSIALVLHDAEQVQRLGLVEPSALVKLQGALQHLVAHRHGRTASDRMRAQVGADWVLFIPGG